MTAQQVVQQYYADVNARDYLGAFNLMADSNPTKQVGLTSFTQGYQNTAHDVLVVNGTQLRGDGTVEVDVNLTATDTSNATTSFSGYYLVGVVNGSWLILQGSLQ